MTSVERPLTLLIASLSLALAASPSRLPALKLSRRAGSPARSKLAVAENKE